jgi:hypothetical protein
MRTDTAISGLTEIAVHAENLIAFWIAIFGQPFVYLS